MNEKLKIYEGTGCDPHYNLAVEQYLLETAEQGCTLYLWQNKNTVVIGRNQNAWKECRTSLLEAEGGHLARRLSGGGAVFHDLGNLNFTFLMPSENYDLDRQFEVIRQACRMLGIDAERSGRNDLTASGRKFSGNAFYHNAGHSYHHGTLLVDADMEKMARYLNPSEAKLNAKGVDSVRARVVNLKELNRDVTVERLKAALKEAFGAVYGGTVCPVDTTKWDLAALDALHRRAASWEWNYGQKLPFDFSCEHRFAWGELRIELQVTYGRVRGVSVFSDAMDWSIAPALEAALAGCRFKRGELTARVRQSGIAQRDDVCALLDGQDI